MIIKKWSQIFVLTLLCFEGNSQQLQWSNEAIFYDDFNESSINLELWAPGPYFVGGNPEAEFGYTPLTASFCIQFPDNFACQRGNVHCYVEDNVILQNSMCEIKSTFETSGFECNGAKFVKSGVIVSNRKFKYGTFEARIKMDVANGLWPAFWLYGCDDGGLDCGEIDIFEINSALNDKFTNNWHRVSYDSPGVENGHTEDLKGFDLNSNFAICFGNGWNSLNLNSTISDWHVYKMVWSQQGIFYYIDDIFIRYADVAIPEALHLIINQAVYSNDQALSSCPSGYLARSSPDPGNFPKSMYIDWVKVTPILECDDFSFCNYTQSFGHGRTSYFGENIEAGGNNCQFSYVHGVSYGAKVMDFRAVNSISLKPGFSAPAGTVFTAKIVSEASIICDFPFLIENSDTLQNRSLIENSNELKSDEILVFPNPTDGKINITYPDFNGDESIEIRIYNNIGQEIITEDKIVETVDLSFLPKGIYFIEIKSPNRIFRKKIVKQN